MGFDHIIRIHRALLQDNWMKMFDANLLCEAFSQSIREEWCAQQVAIILQALSTHARKLGAQHPRPISTRTPPRAAREVDGCSSSRLAWMGMWESRKAHTEGGERASVWRHHGASNQTQKIHLLRDKLTNSQRARCRKHFDFQVSALGLINSARRWMDGINKTWSAGEIQFHPATLRNQKQ